MGTLEMLDVLENGHVLYNGELVLSKLIGRPIVIKVEIRKYRNMGVLVEPRKPLHANGFAISNKLEHDKTYFFGVQYFQFKP